MRKIKNNKRIKDIKGIEDINDWTFFELAHQELISEGKYNYNFYDLLVYARRILNWWNKHRCFGKREKVYRGL